ncbi:hypothetical protein C8233_17365 [Halomonas sp. SF2003]|nr:hypothetical protein C8233_17365 [Halomonas sp. SF2003]
MMDNALICLGEVRSQSLQADEMARRSRAAAYDMTSYRSLRESDDQSHIVSLGDYDVVGGDARQGAGIVVGARRGIRPARHATRRQCLRLRALLPGSELSRFHRTN